MMRCAVCLEPLEEDGPLGYVHADGSRFGADQHAIQPVWIE